MTGEVLTSSKVMGSSWDVVALALAVDLVCDGFGHTCAWTPGMTIM